MTAGVGGPVTGKGANLLILDDPVKNAEQANSETYRAKAWEWWRNVAVTRLAFSQGHELQPHGGTAVAITPGWLRSEMMLDIYGVTEDTWREATVGNPHFVAISESPRFVGRAVAARLAPDDRARLLGRLRRPRELHGLLHEPGRRLPGPPGDPRLAAVQEGHQCRCSPDRRAASLCSRSGRERVRGLCGRGDPLRDAWSWCGRGAGRWLVGR